MRGYLPSQQTTACQERAGGGARPINVMLIRDAIIKPIVKLFSPDGPNGCYERTSYKKDMVAVPLPAKRFRTLPTASAGCYCGSS